MARDGGRGRGDWRARRGSRDSGPYAEGSTGDNAPVDIAAVRRDDALIDAIASDGPVQTDSTEEFQLAALLADWRAEIVTPPIPEAPDLDTVVAAVNQEIGARQARVGARTTNRLRLVRPIAGAAAGLALVFGGMTAFSYNAEPGDPLWRFKEVVFSEQAQSTVVQRADDDLAAAQELIDQGNPERARARLEQASTNATKVDDPAKRADLMDRWQRLLNDLRGLSPEAAAQLEQSRPGEPRPGSTTEPGAATGTTKPGETTRPGGGDNTGSTAPTIMGVDPSVSATKPPVTTAPDTTVPTTPPTTEPQDTGVPPTVEPTTPPETTPPPVTPTTVSQSTIIEPPVITTVPDSAPTGGNTGAPGTGGSTG
ncbi:anti-sigma-D factor RsdA [Nocardia cyriacigeorgica]|uniref:anti-sigma-D factor RsdA n=1 Tax=Nocardia cyriacigeorgica TaxID=135487 RepID=UPI00245754A7|nr:anti-sigma-D factor RsdA [Nocardia cyriacigeorgica]